jgi:hypothetical protein
MVLVPRSSVICLKLQVLPTVNMLQLSKILTEISFTRLNLLLVICGLFATVSSGYNVSLFVNSNHTWAPGQFEQVLCLWGFSFHGIDTDTEEQWVPSRL